MLVVAAHSPVCFVSREKRDRLVRLLFAVSLAVPADGTDHVSGISGKVDPAVGDVEAADVSGERGSGSRSGSRPGSRQGWGSRAAGRRRRGTGAGEEGRGEESMLG